MLHYKMGALHEYVGRYSGNKENLMLFQTTDNALKYYRNHDGTFVSTPFAGIVDSSHNSGIDWSIYWSMNKCQTVSQGDCVLLLEQQKIEGVLLCKALGPEKVGWIIFGNWLIRSFVLITVQ